jgi:hypothetical protein
MKKQPKKTKREQKDEEEHLLYPPTEDIYNQAEKVDELDPDTFERKTPVEDPDSKNEKDFEEAKSGSDLDIPKENDIPGVEDEENDFYSLGGEKDG